MTAAHRRAIERWGQSVLVQRISGEAPRTVTYSASIQAIVRDRKPDTADPERSGYGGREIGAITQTYRDVILMATDLEAARFPLPLRKNDKIILASGEKLNVVMADAEKRLMAGAIELTVAGVA